MRYLVIDTTTNAIENIVEWDGISDWSPGEGKTAVQHETANTEWTYDGENFIPPVVTASPATSDMVAAERERRLALGFTYAFSDGRGDHRFGTTPADMAGWSEVTTLANAMIALGAGTNAISIKTQTGLVSVTALEWQAILIYAGLNFREPIWHAYFTNAGLDPIPADFADDSRWPAVQ